MTTLRDKALRFATVAHAEQVRKYSGEPYIIHPIAVAGMLINPDEATIAAALCHDVIEDTKATYKDVELFLGTEVADLVLEVSDISVPSDGNRAARKEIDRQHYGRGSRRAQNIKCSDITHNTIDILSNDPNFSKVYVKEMEMLLPMLSKADSNMFNMAFQAVEEAKLKLEQARLDLSLQK